MLIDNNVCVVADPYLISIDGMPKLDILLDNFKRKNFSTKNFINDLSMDVYLRKDRKTMRSVLNEIGQTKKSR
jgi:hypothetical protein